MCCIFLVVTLVINYIHRLKSVILEVFVLVTCIIIILYSSVSLSFQDHRFVQFLSIKHHLLDRFLYKSDELKSLQDVSKGNSFLRNYILYQKKDIKNSVYVYVVSKFTQNFFKILSDNKVVNDQEINILINQYPILNNLQLGQVVSLITVQGHGLRSVLWRVSDKESRVYNRVAFSNMFTENIIVKFDKINKWDYWIIVGRLHDNFINSAKSLGLDKNNIQVIIDALQCQLNFQRLRIGDNFSVLLVDSKNYGGVNNEFMNQIVTAVRLHSVGRDYYAFRADNGRFYNRDAIGVTGDFIKFPTVEPFRISSGFNLHRLNPITGRISPHFGVDFAVPIGTPVLSIGNGKVIISQYDRISGNYIAVRHNSRCVSRYMHLNRILVKSGQIVKKGENIALSGNTGRSTGPHLHFELWINHKPVNPLTAKFLSCETLHGCDRANYFNKVNSVLPYLQLHP